MLQLLSLLVHFDPKKELVLYNRENGIKKQMAFISCAISVAQRKYSQLEK